MAVLAGDVFDNLLSLPDDCVSDIQMAAARIVRLCKDMNIVLLILEGTPLHDRHQSEVFVQQNERLKESTGVGCELYYVDTLSIVHINSLHLDILCVPDECRSTTQVAQEDIKELMRSKGLRQVDYAVMHGCFRYQVPQIAKDHIKFDEDFFLSIVKHLIWIGHIHQASQYERILAAGSFDRLCHGDENVKGALKCRIKEDGTWSAYTLENRGAKVYKSIVCNEDSVEDALIRIEKQVKKLVPGSYVQIETSGAKPILQAHDALSTRWPDLVWSFLNRQTPKKSIEALQESKKYEPLIINPSTIQELCMKRMSQDNIPSHIHARALDLLQTVM